MLRVMEIAMRMMRSVSRQVTREKLICGQVVVVVVVDDDDDVEDDLGGLGEDFEGDISMYLLLMRVVYTK